MECRNINFKRTGNEKVDEAIVKLSRLISVQRWRKIEISEVDKVDSDSGRVSINFALTFVKTLKYG